MNYIDAVNQGFDGVDREDLVRFCKDRDITIRSNTTDEYMVSALKADASKAVVEQKTNVRKIRNVGPNLSPIGKWGGRRRNVILQEDEQDKKTAFTSVSWDSNTIFIKKGEIASIPYPHYEALKNAINYMPVVIATPTGRKEEERRIPALPFQDLGDDPETAHLPRNYLEFKAEECRKANYYAASPRSELTKLLAQLSDGVMDRYVIKEMSDEEVREQVLLRLNVYNESDLAEAA
jgi:hypothetical protein